MLLKYVRVSRTNSVARTTSCNIHGQHVGTHCSHLGKRRALSGTVISESPAVSTDVDGPVMTITLHRPHRRNAVDRPTASALLDAFERFEASPDVFVAVLTGGGGHFCAGADLAAFADPALRNVVDAYGAGPGPMGPTRLQLSKPTIAAVEGYAVAGGLELALLCDLRVAASSATFGVFCRRWGVPLIDGGTVRLPRIIGHGRAMDMVLTGRAVCAAEALSWGLVSRVVADGAALSEAQRLAREIASHPRDCTLADRASVLAQWGLAEGAALAAEGRGGAAVLAGAEAGVAAFVGGAGRGGVGRRRAVRGDPD